MPPPPEIPTDLQAALGERYALRRLLGRGGMATVYLSRTIGGGACA